MIRIFYVDKVLQLPIGYIGFEFDFFSNPFSTFFCDYFLRQLIAQPYFKFRPIK